MSCNCTHTECIEVYIAPCTDTVTLPIVADSTGIWKMIYEFNGMPYRADVQAIIGEKLVVPAKFNENYKHIVKFFKPDGSLFMDTCFTINIMLTVFASGGVTPSDVVFDVTVTEDGPSFTDPRLAGETVASFSTNGGDYNAPYFDKPLSSDTLTTTEVYGSDFYAGQIITVTLKH